MLKIYDLEPKVTLKKGSSSVDGVDRALIVKAGDTDCRDADPQAWPFPEDWDGFC